MARNIVIISLMVCALVFKLKDDKQIDAYKSSIDKQFEHDRWEV